MSRVERTGWRDEAFSRWHRSLEPEDENRLTAIDCDWLEYCPRCYETLAVYELCADIERTDKHYVVTLKAARRLGVPAWCILYQPTADGSSIEKVRAKKIAPWQSDWVLTSPQALEALILKLHASCPYCGHSSVVAPPRTALHAAAAGSLPSQRETN